MAEEKSSETSVLKDKEKFGEHEGESKDQGGGEKLKDMGKASGEAQPKAGGRK